MNKQKLIKKYENTCCTIISINGILEDLRQLDEPQSMKLKDVIARIKKLDLGTQKVWLNEILNELGSDYGTLKYKAGYEQGKLEGEYVGRQLKDADKIRQELNKPTIPQFVADWYEKYKGNLEYNIWDWMRYNFEPEKMENEKFSKWLNDFENDPVETLVKMKLYGYTVEKEKRYSVRIKGVDSCFECLYYGMGSNTWSFRMKHESGYFRRSHTRKELEKAGFGWVFDCPGVEIEEVTE